MILLHFVMHMFLLEWLQITMMKMIIVSQIYMTVWVNVMEQLGKVTVDA